MPEPTIFTSETTPLLYPPASDTPDPQQRHYEQQQLDSNPNLSTEISWTSEIRLLLFHSASLSLTYLLQYAQTLTTVLIASQLSTSSLAAVSLGSVTMNITGYAVFEGMATSLDTLCAQAYGAGNILLVGLQVQRMFVLQLLVTLPITALWLSSPHWLPLLVPLENGVSEAAGWFLIVSLTGLPGYAAFEAGKRFAQAQGDFITALGVLIFCCPLHILLSWVFVFHLHWGISGAALAAAISNTARPILLTMYLVAFAPQTHQCWPGLSRAIFQNWTPMVRLSVAGAIVTLSEWFAFEILIFSTSYLGAAPLAAQTLLSSLTVLVWHIPFPASIALSTRIGHLIGCGAVDAAKQAARRFHAPLFAAIGLLDMALVALVLRHDSVTRFLVRDASVRTLVRGAAAPVAAFQFFDAVACGMQGLFRGLGAQAVAGWITFGVNYGFAVPLALALELGKPRLGLGGIWVALGSGLCVLAAVEALVVRFVPWERFIAGARKRDEVVVIRAE